MSLLNLPVPVPLVIVPYDWLEASKAEVAELRAALAAAEAREAERDKPCVWTKVIKKWVGNYQVGSCSPEHYYAPTWVPNFCPGCGHPVQIKEET
jgi:hypothetical protein